MTRLYDYRKPLERANAPCKNCQTRYVGCHSSCVKYNDWKQERQVLLDRKKAESDLNGAFLDVTYHAHSAMKKKSHKNK